MIIASHCQTVEQQDLFINKVAECSLTTAELRNELVKGISGDSVKVDDDLVVHSSYDLKELNIEQAWKENEIKAHIEKNIILFINIVLSSNWSFLPRQNIFIGDRINYLDLVFYNVISRRYLIVELKNNCLVAGINRGKNQIISYVEAYNQQVVDFSYQKPTIGLILGKSPIDKKFFSHTETPSCIFYSSFTI